MGIILAIFVFSVLVIFHEMGHFLIAKKNGIGVTEFSIGMGPRLFSFVKGGTRYSLKLIMFGGSCAMVGNDMFEAEYQKDDEEEEESIEGIKDEREDSFNNKSVWARIAVIAAGPIFNFILAWVLAVVLIGLEGFTNTEITGIAKKGAAAQAGLEVGDEIKEYNGHKLTIGDDFYMYTTFEPITGDPISVTYERDGKEYKTQINPAIWYAVGISYTANKKEAEIQVSKKSAADLAGLKSGDVVAAINGNKIGSGEELSEYTTENPFTKDEVEITVLRDGEEKVFNVTPQNAGYYIGLSVGAQEKGNALQVLRYSFTQLRYNIEVTVKSFGMLFTGKLNKDDVSGVVGIVKIVGDSYEETRPYGPYYVFLQIVYLLIIFSVNLGVVNLFPFPALDGGRLVFLIIEAIRRKPVSKKVEAYFTLAGVFILFALMILIMINDITKFFR